MKLEGKVALVTGGAQGLGRSIALKLAQEGADVAIDVRNIDDDGHASLADLVATGRRAIMTLGDISDVEGDKRVIAEVVEKLGKVDILVNNAGVEMRDSFWDVTEKNYDTVMGINMKGTFFMTQAFVNHLRATNRPGRVINISSVHEDLPFPHFTSYCCSKGAMKMFCRNLAVELAPLGITVNNIAPGAIETPINTKLLNNPAQLNALLKNIPLGRLGQPGDVAGVAAFLASDDASYMTGSTVYVDGGLLWNYSEQ